MSPTLQRLTLLAVFLAGAPVVHAQVQDQQQASPDGAPAPAPAAESISVDRPSYNTHGMLFGDLLGVRSALHRRGVDLTANYGNEFATNLQGGTRKDATADGQLTFNLVADMQQLLRLRGGTFQTTISSRHGPSLDTLTGLGTLQQTQEVYGGGQTWRLTEFSYRQQLGAGVDFKVGRLNMSSDFAVFGCDFENLTFCGGAPGNIAYSYWHNFPNSQWGGILRIKRKSWYAMIGAYESNPTLAASPNFIFTRGGATGFTTPFEMGWTPRLGARGLPGTYKLGFWYNSDRADDILLDLHRNPIALTGLGALQDTGRVGGYVSLRQQLTGRAHEGSGGVAVASQGITAFANVLRLEDRTSRVDGQIAIGFNDLGLFAGRPDDDLGIAIGRNHLNGRAALNDQLASGNPDRASSEYSAELNYGLRLSPWLLLRPNIQYIIHPGGFRHANDVVVLGLKTNVTL